MKPIYLMAAAAALTLSACSGSGKQEIVDEKEELPIVEIDVAHVQDVPQSKSYTANVEADNINNIAPSMPNRIVNILAEVGDKVAKGQTLVTLDRANIDQLKVQMDNAKRELDRAQQLLEIGAGTQQSVDNMQAQYDALKTQYNNLLENTVLVSPISGVVTARNYDPGDMTGQMPVLTIGQIQPYVKVMINVTEADLTKVHAGQSVDITFDALPGQTFEGKISRLYPTVDPSTRTFKTEILVPNNNGQILPGMFARVDIGFGSQLNAVVPDRAIVKQTGSGNKYVYVYRNGTVDFVRVELGQRIGTTYELLSGIADGDTVVISGQSRLADGVPVQLLNRK